MINYMFTIVCPIENELVAAEYRYSIFPLARHRRANAWHVLYRYIIMATSKDMIYSFITRDDVLYIVYSVISEGHTFH